MNYSFSTSPGLTLWKTLSRALLAATLAATLVGCASSVKLDEAPVENKTGTLVTSPTNGTGAKAGGVAPVEIMSSNSLTGGPNGVAKVIYFDYDSFTLKPEYQSAVDAHAKFMAANKGKRLALEGHTDERGGREYNLALGQKRAETVRRAMGLLGVGDAQVEAVSFGKEKPAETGSSEAAFAKNRRVELTYR